jgi:hypothetical protein
MAISKINSKSLEDSTVLSADIADDSIIDADIKSDAAIVTSKLSGAVTSIPSHGLATSATTDTTNADNISSGTVNTARLGTGAADNTKFLRGDNTWQVVAIGATQLDLPTVTGTLSVLYGGTVTHTITNWSDDLSWTITPTNCTVSTVNASGEFVVTHTSGLPSYTIIATTASLGLADSNTVTKNLTTALTAPTISSPADVGTAIDVIYTITSTTVDDDKLILNPGTANFTFVNVSGGGTASHVGNTVECVGFTTNNPVVTIQFTAQATYSVTATSVKIDGSFGTSAASNTDNITIANRVLTAPSLSSPADVGTATDVVYTITSNDADDNKLILDPGTANFTYQGVSGATASKVGNTVECVSFGASNPVVTIQFTAEATYSVTATAADTASYYGTSAASSADSITILNPTLSAPAISSPANVGTLTDAAYTITSNDINDNKLILDIGSSNFNFGNVNTGIASKVGNTVECTGFTTNNPVVTIQFTVEATYSVTAKAIDTAGYYHDSASSSADSITIQNFVGNIEYLVVAGAGGGGGTYGGGGGAGGYRTNYGSTVITLTQGNVYTAYVGLGGAGGPLGSFGTSGAATAGDYSSLSGTGITTITATAGGQGGGYNGYSPGTGGSGGGGYRGGSGVAGNTGGNGGAPSIPEGYAGGNAWSGGGWPAGGGGGAGAVGSNYVGITTGGAGGVGKSNSITGSALYYAGGGGGGSEGWATGIGGAGGNGGGGNGGKYAGASGLGVNGTDGRGGGGGGSSYGSGSYGGGGDGGNGVVILRIATTDYNSSGVSGGTAVSSGSDTVITFTGAGTYTA